jgi:hypothetical protein
MGDDSWAPFDDYDNENFRLKSRLRRAEALLDLILEDFRTYGSSRLVYVIEDIEDFLGKVPMKKDGEIDGDITSKENS